MPPSRRRLGQHFLVDPNIVRKIMTAAALEPHATVLEIGPGRGILTRALCVSARSVIAVEVDARLVADLRRDLAGTGNLDLHHADALEFPFAELPPGTVVVANLPYSISTPILFRLLEAWRRIDRMVLMLQAEVARRIVAEPGTKDYGILSVVARYWSEPALAFTVSPRCFRPSPAVSSAVVTLAIRRVRLVPERDEPLLTRLVRAAFAHRRKTLFNSLRNEGWPPERITQALAACRIKPARRAETLSVEEFAALTRAFARPLTPDA